MAVIEYSRNVLNLSDANSTEMNNDTSNPVISLMENQKNITEMGGTMRLGSWKCDLIENSWPREYIQKVKLKKGTDIDMNLILVHGYSQNKGLIFQDLIRYQFG